MALDIPYISNASINPRIHCYTSRMISFSNYSDTAISIGIQESQTDNNITQGMMVYALHYLITDDGKDEIVETRGNVSDSYISNDQKFYSTSIVFDNAMRGAPVFNIADQLIGVIYDVSTSNGNQTAIIPVESIKFK